MNEQGLLTIYKLQDVAVPGYMPSEKLVTYTTAYYEERSVGVTRAYNALAVNQRIDGFVRVLNTVLDGVDDQLYVIKDNKQYRVSMMQKVIGHDAYDLTLERLEENYDVADET